MTLINAIEIAKQKAANSAKWTRAIDRAAAGLQSGELCVTLLHNGALVTSPRGSYFVSAHCECEASRRGHQECYHRAAVRLVEMMETETAPKGETKRQAVVTRSIERRIEYSYTGANYPVVYCDGWHI